MTTKMITKREVREALRTSKHRGNNFSFYAEIDEFRFSKDYLKDYIFVFSPWYVNEVVIAEVTTQLEFVNEVHGFMTEMRRRASKPSLEHHETQSGNYLTVYAKDKEEAEIFAQEVLDKLPDADEYDYMAGSATYVSEPYKWRVHYVM